MKINDMFAKDVTRPINGVIKVMQTDDENRRQELEEYVVTRELQKHFGSFYDHYQEGLEGPTDRMGVWISGFFGSGKSHFLKILSYLLKNDVVEGKCAIDYFGDKFAYDPIRYEMMRRAGQMPTETILFNIDAKSPMGKDEHAILRVFTKVFYEHLGFYGDDLKIARFERFLSKQGKLEAFKAAFLEINTEPWESAREAFAFWQDDVVLALTRVTDMSEAAALNWFNGEETASLSIDLFAREVLEYVEGKGPDFHLIFLVDEIGQYIGDNSSLMLNLQTVVEELGSKCRGRVWVIVTSQEDIDSVTHVKGNDFSKIQGRFDTRLSLSSASVDEVIKRRVLDKTPEAAQLLALVYQQNASALRNLFAFTGAQSDLKGYADENEFIACYPFVPYQFKLLQNVFMEVRKHGSSGKHLSEGARSMLSAFKEAAMRVREEDESVLVSFCSFYDTVHTFLDGAIRRVIDRADRAAQDGDGLKPEDVDVLKLLFLIRYVNGEIPNNLDNITTLMVTRIDADKIDLRGRLLASLDRLIAQNYVSRNGDSYQFLTDEEQDVNREIRSIIPETSEVVRLIGQLVFADIYEGRKFRYKNRYDFTYDPMVDQAIVGQPMSDIRLRLVTSVDEFEDGSETRLLLQSGANNEAIVLLAQDNDYYAELQEVLRIGKYVKKCNVSQLPQSIRQIVQIKQGEAREREKYAKRLLGEAIAAGTYFIAGERAQIRCSSPKEALDAAMTRLVETVYSKLGEIDRPARGDADIAQILSGEGVQETLSGVDRPNARAQEDVMLYVEIKSRQHMSVTVSDIMRHCKAAPYGWQEIDTAAQIAALMRAQRLTLTLDGVSVAASSKKAIECLRKKPAMDRTLVKMQVKVEERLLREAREQAKELFRTLDLASDEENFCGQLASLLGEKLRQNNAVKAHYAAGAAYPGKAIAEQGDKLLSRILDQQGDHVTFLEAFTAARDDLLDWSEDFKEVEFFFKNQRAIFDGASALCAKAKRDHSYFADEEEATRALGKMETILRDARPYRRVVELPTLMQAVNAAYARLSDARRARVEEAIVQARGDIHTLAADYPSLRDEIRRADDELERRRQSAMEASGPVELDALITQIIYYRDSVCRGLEKEIAALQNKPVEPALRVKTLRRYDVLPQKRLSSAAEVDAYVEALRARLMEELEDSDAIQLN